MASAAAAPPAAAAAFAFARQKHRRRVVERDEALPEAARRADHDDLSALHRVRERAAATCGGGGVHPARLRGGGSADGDGARRGAASEAHRREGRASGRAPPRRGQARAGGGGERRARRREGGGLRGGGVDGGDEGVARARGGVARRRGAVLPGGDAEVRGAGRVREAVVAREGVPEADLPVRGGGAEQLRRLEVRDGGDGAAVPEEHARRADAQRRPPVHALAVVAARGGRRAAAAAAGGRLPVGEPLREVLVADARLPLGAERRDGRPDLPVADRARPRAPAARGLLLARGAEELVHDAHELLRRHGAAAVAVEALEERRGVRRRAGGAAADAPRCDAHLRAGAAEVAKGGGSALRALQVRRAHLRDAAVLEEELRAEVCAPREVLRAVAVPRLAALLVDHARDDGAVPRRPRRPARRGVGGRRAEHELPQLGGRGGALLGRGALSREALLEAALLRALGGAPLGALRLGEPRGLLRRDGVLEGGGVRAERHERAQRDAARHPRPQDARQHLGREVPHARRAGRVAGDERVAAAVADERHGRDLRAVAGERGEQRARDGAGDAQQRRAADGVGDRLRRGEVGEARDGAGGAGGAGRAARPGVAELVHDELVEEADRQRGARAAGERQAHAVQPAEARRVEEAHAAVAAGRVEQEEPGGRAGEERLAARPEARQAEARPARGAQRGGRGGRRARAVEKVLAAEPRALLLRTVEAAAARRRRLVRDRLRGGQAPPEHRVPLLELPGAIQEVHAPPAARALVELGRFRRKRDRRRCRYRCRRREPPARRRPGEGEGGSGGRAAAAARRERRLDLRPGDQPLAAAAQRGEQVDAAAGAVGHRRGGERRGDRVLAHRLCEDGAVRVAGRRASEGGDAAEDAAEAAERLRAPAAERRLTAAADAADEAAAVEDDAEPREARQVHGAAGAPRELLPEVAQLLGRLRRGRAGERRRGAVELPADAGQLRDGNEAVGVRVVGREDVAELLDLPVGELRRPRLGAPAAAGGGRERVLREPGLQAAGLGGGPGLGPAVAAETREEEFEELLPGDCAAAVPVHALERAPHRGRAAA